MSDEEMAIEIIIDLFENLVRTGAANQFWLGDGWYPPPVDLGFPNFSDVTTKLS